MYPMMPMCPMPYPTAVMPATDVADHCHNPCYEKELARKEACYKKYMCKYKALAEKAEACKDRAHKCLE